MPLEVALAYLGWECTDRHGNPEGNSELWTNPDNPDEKISIDDIADTTDTIEVVEYFLHRLREQPFRPIKES